MNNLTNSDYRVSIIIPVYNAEEYLGRCMNSILSQNFDKDQMQIILVNNNSTDASPEICYGYAQGLYNIEVYNEKKQGVSYARNLGLEKARGQYIMFVDADDYIGLDTVSNVVNFFDEHYDEIDMVTYHEKRLEGNKVKEHLRYRYLTETGIYNLNQNYFICQVRLNICIKNNLNGLRFCEDMNFQEDQKFCCDILAKKMKIGYVAEGEYYYDIHEDGLVNVFSGAQNYFEISTSFFESVFSKYHGKKVPPYFQALFYHDLIWKFKINRLWPYHYTPDELEKAKQRIYNLLSEVSDDIILSYPDTDKYEAVYWLRNKKNSVITPYVAEKYIGLFSNGKEVYNRQSVEVILKKIQIKKDCYKIVAFFKSVHFSFMDKPKAYAIIDGKDKVELELKDCAAGYYKVKEKTCTFWSFEFSRTVKVQQTIQFEVVLDGIPQTTVFWYMPTVPFVNGSDENTYVMGNLSVTAKDGKLQFHKIEGFYKQELQNKDNKRFEERYPELYKLRRDIFNNPGDSRTIWLYTDSATVAKDNAFYQFIHDIDKKDGIERYYVVTNPKVDYRDLSDEIRNKMIVFRSERHANLFFRASKIITSFSENEVIWPYAEPELQKLMRDMFNADVIYLQHGVLHARLPWHYSKVVSGIDKVVVSSQFESELLTGSYDYDSNDIIPAGMARYDILQKTESPEKGKKKILFALSWRSYLVGTRNNTTLTREKKSDYTKKSNYYKNIMEFLNSTQLSSVLAENDIYLDVKLHPEFDKLYKDEMNFTNENVSLVSENVHFEDYHAVITDFSSLLYDFVYLRRAIIYFIPDKDEFRAGMNHYRELELPLEDGFGPVCYSPDQLLDALSELINHSFQIEDKYSERMDHFFFDLKDCREKTYKTLIESK